MAYTELDTIQNLIRLLHLSPASSEEALIRYHFSVAFLDNKHPNNKPAFEAL